ncbi:MAG: undecaprenyl-phosphate galactose phosphotransferase WbaP [Treponema sp.]|nr:undecaprenyl-phosphate galactose phosphotransferase WbaP [Treponema sp.]
MNQENLQEKIRSQYKHTTSFFFGLMLALFDAMSILISTGFGFFIVNAISPHTIWLRAFIKYIVFFPGIFAIFYIQDLYPGILLPPEEQIRRFSFSTFLCFVGEAFILSTMKNTATFLSIAAALVIAWPTATILLPVGREIGKRIHCNFSTWGVPAVVYTHGDQCKQIVERLLVRKHYGYKPVLIITDTDDHPDSFMGIPVKTSTDEIKSMLKKLKIKVAIICGYTKEIESVNSAYRYVITIPENQYSAAISLKIRDFGGVLGFSTTNYLTRPIPVFIKRLIDIIACILIAVIVIPVTIIIAVIIKITSPGPVFYGHKRVGKNHKEIKCWKFRSMCNNSQEILEQILATDPVRREEWERDRKFTDDPRVTKFGKFLRKTSLDELPQIWNIFTGEMSLVGPRPVTQDELIKYGTHVDYVLSVKPGLSGMWQVSGRSETSYEERILFDTYYIQNWSVWLDLWILIKTFWVVLIGKGAY